MDEIDYTKYTIITYADSSPNVYMRITHIPSGLFVDGKGKMCFKLRKKLLNQLKEKLASA